MKTEICFPPDCFVHRRLKGRCRLPGIQRELPEAGFVGCQRLEETAGVGFVGVVWNL